MIGDIASKRYAKGLLETAIEKNCVDKIHSDINKVVAILEDGKDIKSMLFSPVFPIDKKMGIVEILVQKLNLHELSHNFLNLLVDKKRISNVSGIFEYLDEMKNTKEGKVRAEIFTASKPDNVFLNELKNKFKKQVGKEIIPEIKTDPTVIGGIKVKIGSKLFDNTIKTQLEEIEKKI